MVWIALAVVYVVWGSTYFAIALVVQTMPALLAAGLRHLIAGIAVTAWVAARDRGGLRVSRRELGGAALVGALLLGSGNGFVSLAERTVPSGLAALVIASVPLWIVIIRTFRGEHVGADIIGGVSLGLAGVAVLVVPSGMSGQLDPLGLAMIFVATLSWATGTYISPRLALPRNVFASTAYQMLSAGIILTVVSVLLGEVAEVDVARFSTASLLGFAFLVLFGSLAAYSSYTWLLRNAPVSLVSTYAYVNPVIAVFLGTVFLSEPISPTTIAGAALIVAAVAFIVTRTATARRAAAT